MEFKKQSNIQFFANLSIFWYYSFLLLFVYFFYLMVFIMYVKIRIFFKYFKNTNNTKNYSSFSNFLITKFEKILKFFLFIQSFFPSICFLILIPITLYIFSFWLRFHFFRFSIFIINLVKIIPNIKNIFLSRFWELKNLI